MNEATIIELKSIARDLNVKIAHIGMIHSMTISLMSKLDNALLGHDAQPKPKRVYSKRRTKQQILDEVAVKTEKCQAFVKVETY